MTMQSGNTVSALSRRDFLAASATASALILAPVRALAAAVKPVRITGVDIFSDSATGVEGRRGGWKDDALSGVPRRHGRRCAGLLVRRADPKALPAIQAVLVGKDLFNIEGHLKNGPAEWGGVEHAIWDAIGRIAGQPV